MTVNWFGVKPARSSKFKGWTSAGWYYYKEGVCLLFGPYSTLESARENANVHERSR